MRTARRRVLALFATKWTSMVLDARHDGSSRAGVLQRSLPGVSKKMLTQTFGEWRKAASSVVTS